MDGTRATACPWPYRGGMHWDELLADLASQFDGELRTRHDDEVIDVAEAEMAQTELADRLAARRGEAVHLRLLDGHVGAGTLLDAAGEWLLLADGPRRVLVPLAAVVAAWPLGAVAVPGTGVERRLRLGHVLRALAREGSQVLVRSLAGDHRGWITRVGKDHIDLRDASGATAGEDLTLALRHVVLLRSG